jgi:hypothetical protein
MSDQQKKKMLEGAKRTTKAQNKYQQFKGLGLDDLVGMRSREESDLSYWLKIRAINLEVDGDLYEDGNLTQLKGLESQLLRHRWCKLLFFVKVTLSVENAIRNADCKTESIFLKGSNDKMYFLVLNSLNFFSKRCRLQPDREPGFVRLGSRLLQWEPEGRSETPGNVRFG